MNVRVSIRYRPITDEHWESMRSLARKLTDNPKSIRVSLDETPEYLVVEFTMPRDSQTRAVEAIDRVMRFDTGRGLDSRISFPRTAEEEAQAKRKNEQRKAKRRAKRESGT
jgi:hypothetical protein